MLFKTSFISQVVLVVGLILFSTDNIYAQPGKAKVNGITIAYEAFGDSSNDAIVLIQGTGATLLHYPVKLCENLAREGYYVIRFDNRDIGLSTHLDSLGQPDWAAIGPLIGTCDPAPLQYSLLDMAEDVIGLLDALHIQNAHIAGASMGGAIAQLMAIHFPERVRTLTCLSASTGNPNLPEAEEEALKAMSTPPPATTVADTIARHLVYVYQALGAVDDEKVLFNRAMEHVTNRNWDPMSVNRQVAAVIVGESCDRREQLAKLKMPITVIHGDADPLVTIESGHDLANSISHSELCIIEGLGHDISLKFIDEIAACMLKGIRNN